MMGSNGQQTPGSAAAASGPPNVTPIPLTNMFPGQGLAGLTGPGHAQHMAPSGRIADPGAPYRSVAPLQEVAYGQASFLQLDYTAAGLLNPQMLLQR
jgi:hypothetical protein